MLSRISLSVALITLAISSGTGAMAGSAPANDCDLMAASPDDADRPEGVSGVAFSDLTASEEAVLACEQAIEAHPRERRFLTNLARLHAKNEAYRDAAVLYRAAHEMGSAVAANNLGSLYSDGLGVPQNQREATRYFRKAAHRGLTYSMFTMGDRARRGVGMNENTSLALYWYDKAAEQNDPQALNDLGVMYRDGVGVAADTDQAVAHFKSAVDADPTSPLPVYNLATMQEEGIGGEPDLNKALSLYMTTFMLGDADVATKIGAFFAEGKGVAVDPDAALHWYLKGSEAGSVTATVALAQAYEEGIGTEANINTARDTYLQALDLATDEQMQGEIQKRLSSLGRHSQTN